MADRKAAPGAAPERAWLCLEDVSPLFPKRKPSAISAYLRTVCGLDAAPDDIVVRGQRVETEWFAVPAGGRLPSDPELRKKLSPEEACVVEAAYVGEFRLKHRGILLNDKFGAVTVRGRGEGAGGEGCGRAGRGLGKGEGLALGAWRSSSICARGASLSRWEPAAPRC